MIEHQPIRLRAALSALGFSLAAFAGAQVTNGGFETGTFSGWSHFGDNQIETSALGTGPAQGKYDALLATETDGTINSHVAAGSGVSGSALVSDDNLSSGALNGLGNGTVVLGSTTTQTLTLVKGAKISFDWDFLTNQTYNDGTSDSVAPIAQNDDFSYVSLVAAGGSPANLQKLADVFYGYQADATAPGGFDTGFTITAASNPFISETGFLSTTIVAPAAGQYTLSFGVAHAVDGTDDGVNSALLVDNVTAAVPEPSSIAFFASCVGFFAVWSRKRNSASFR